MGKIRLAEKISLINQVVLESMNAPSEAVIVKSFIRAAIAILNADYGFSFIKDPKTGEFKLLYKDKNTPYSPQIPRKNGLTTRAFKTRQPLYISMAPSTASVRHDAKAYMKGVVVIPISYKRSNYGTLDICFYKKHNFTQEEKTLCTYIGNGAAQALTIHRLYSNMGNLVRARTKQLRDKNAQLAAENAKDEALLSSIGEGIMAIDTNARIIMMNPQAELIMGLKAANAVGKLLFDTQILYDETGQQIPVEQRPTYKILQSTKYKSLGSASQVHIKDRDGNLIPISLLATPIVHQGKVIGVIQVLRDISREKEIDRVKSELISLASHQLRTPLSAINWYTEALMNEELGSLNPNQKKYLGEIFHANQKMVELVYDFLNVSRMELGTFTLKLSVINVAEIAQSVIKELRPIVNRKKLVISEKFNGNLGQIEADRKIIRLTLQNLLTNAVKYTPNNGQICVEIDLKSSGAPGPVLAITVSDTGYGIPKEQQSKIFTKLFRADNVSRLDTEGTGLGLYLVKSFVDYCKGAITFKSTENKGTTFYVQLPVRIPDTMQS